MPRDEGLRGVSRERDGQQASAHKSGGSEQNKKGAPRQLIIRSCHPPSRGAQRLAGWVAALLLAHPVGRVVA